MVWGSRSRVRRKLASRNLRRHKRSARKTAHVSKPVKRALTKIVRSQEETKYIARQLCNNYTLDFPIHTPYNGTSGGDILPLTLPIPVASGSQQSESLRVGRKITPVKCYVDVQLTFPQVPQGAAIDPSLPLTNELYVTMYLVRSKNLKNWQMYAGATAAAPWNDLLDNGNGNAVPFGNTVAGASGPVLYTDSTMQGYPINTEHYSLIKKKTIKLVRNNGMMVGDGAQGQAPNLPQSCYRGRFYYRLPKLIYDDTPQNVQYYGGYPTNANPMIMFGCALANNQPSYIINPNDSSITGPIPNSVSLSARVHCWFKDA